MASHARQQYYADGETLKKEAREFAMTDELKEKLDSIEWGAEVNVIEDVKVNGVSLEVVDKSVDVLVPLVIDNLYTVDGDNALSAKQGKILYDYIQNLQSRGRYLSNWNTATGLPSTNPSESPYEYRSGDYFVVSVVAPEGGTNYRPDGSSYTIGVASTTVETEDVKVTDIYLYDGTNWLLLTNSTREIPIDDALSTTSTNPVENRVVTNAINTKQDKLIAGNNIQIAQDGKTISATDTTYSAGTNVNIDTNNVISAVDTTYTAGANINIDANNVISATDTVYAEGTGIDITNNIISNEGVLSVNGSNGNVTVNDVKVSSTAPANPAEGVVWYDTTNDQLKVWDGTNWKLTGKVYSAGTNISIDASDVISADTQFVVVDTLPSVSSADVNKVYILGPIGTGADKYEEWIVTETVGTISFEFDDSENQYNPNTITFSSSKQLTISSYDNTTNGNNANLSISHYDSNTGTYDYFSDYADEGQGFGWYDCLGGMFPVFIDANTITIPAGTYDIHWGLMGGPFDSITFTDGTSTKSWTKIGETSQDLTGAVWGNITGTLSNQTDLQEALDTDRLKSFYLPADVTTAESLATAQAAYEYMAVGVPVLRMGSMYDTSPGTLTFFPVKKVNQGESGTMIFLSTQLSKANYGGNTMIYQDRVEFTVVDGQVTSITKQFTNANSTLFKFLETNVNYGGTYTPTYAGSPTNKKYVDKGDTAVSATAPTTDLYEGKLWYDTTNDVLKAYDGTNWNVTGKVYTAGTGIDITNDVISCTLNPVTVSQTAPSNPESGDLWFNTTKQTLNLYNGTSWVLVGPEIVPITKAAYDLLSSADKNDGRFYLITDNDGTIYVEWANVQNAPISAGTTAPDTPNEGDIWYDTANDILKVYDGTNWNEVGGGTTYTAGNGIDITNDVISADIVAGNGINITNGTTCITESDRKGPAPSGFHVPTSLEWYRLKNIMTSLSLTTGDSWRINLHIPFAGYRRYSDAAIGSQGTYGTYWTSTPEGSHLDKANELYLDSSNVSTTVSAYRAGCLPVRCFKNSYVAPDSNWTVIQGTLGSTGIFWNQSEGLISITDGTNEYTMMDKNLGATTVYNDGDTLSEANCGKYYQWGNNYGFAWTGSVTTSSTQVDASSYGPGNYYSSDTFITGSYDWSSVQNDDLWGDTSNSTHQECTTNSTLIISSDNANGAGAPSTTPSYIGQQYVDTTNDMLYVATGTSSSSDWTLVGANTGVEVQVISQSDYDALSEAEKNADVIYLITGGSGGLTVAWANVTGKPDLIINPSGGTAGQLLAKTANGYEWTTVNSATWGNISGTLSNQTDLQTALDAKQDELNAGPGISIGEGQVCTEESDRKGPCDSGFHVPSYTEMLSLFNTYTSITGESEPDIDGDELCSNLKLAYASQIWCDEGMGECTYDSEGVGTWAFLWTSTPASSSNAYYASISVMAVDYTSMSGPKSNGNSIRAFKNEPVAPTSSWTTILAGVGDAGIFWNETDGLISLSSDGTNWITIQDRNVGATISGGAGYLYQWGNNNGFVLATPTNTSITKVNTSAYGPTNYYSSSTFIISDDDWSNPSNADLWGDTTNSTHQECGGTIDNVITNTGVLSVNGQTGNVTIESGGMQLAPNSPLTPTYFWYGTQAQYEALSQYYTDVENDTVYFTIDS